MNVPKHLEIFQYLWECSLRTFSGLFQDYFLSIWKKSRPFLNLLWIIYIYWMYIVHNYMELECSSNFSECSSRSGNFRITEKSTSISVERFKNRIEFNINSEMFPGHIQEFRINSKLTKHAKAFLNLLWYIKKKLQFLIL